MAKKRVQVYYSGMVQGVGFRFTTEHIAHKFAVTGWVKNLFDGRVELVGEAEEEQLKKFLEAIRNGPLKYYIKDEEIIWSEPTGEYKEFNIRY